MGLVVFVGLAGAFWFYYKLGMNGVYIPFFGEIILRDILLSRFCFRDDGHFTGGVIGTDFGRAFRRDFRRYFCGPLAVSLIPEPDRLGSIVRNNYGGDIGFSVV